MNYEIAILIMGVIIGILMGLSVCLWRWSMSKHCSNCGCVLEGGICSNCQEELFIFEYQHEYLSPLSNEFSNKVKEQRQAVKKGINL